MNWYPRTVLITILMLGLAAVPAHVCATVQYAQLVVVVVNVVYIFGLSLSITLRFSLARRSYVLASFTLVTGHREL